MKVCFFIVQALLLFNQKGDIKTILQADRESEYYMNEKGLIYTRKYKSLDRNDM